MFGMGTMNRTHRHTNMHVYTHVGVLQRQGVNSSLGVGDIDNYLR